MVLQHRVYGVARELSCCLRHYVELLSWHLVRRIILLPNQLLDHEGFWNNFHLGNSSDVVLVECVRVETGVTCCTRQLFFWLQPLNRLHGGLLLTHCTKLQITHPALLDALGRTVVHICVRSLMLLSALKMTLDRSRV